MNIILIIFGVLLVLVVFGVLGYISFKIFKKAWDSRKWPYVAGKITNASLESSTTDILSGEIDTDYEIIVEYLCEIDGVEQKGNKITDSFMSQKFDHKSRAEKKLEKYPIGKEVTVYYNPNDHTDMLLIPGFWVGHYMLMIFWIAMLIFFGLAYNKYIGF